MSIIKEKLNLEDAVPALAILEKKVEGIGELKNLQLFLAKQLESGASETAELKNSLMFLAKKMESAVTTAEAGYYANILGDKITKLTNAVLLLASKLDNETTLTAKDYKSSVTTVI